MVSDVFDELQRTLKVEGPGAAIDRLCARLREEKDYNSLFYALLMKKRQELGLLTVPTGRSQDLPESAHLPYEDAIRDAARLVGQLYLEEGNIPQAYAYLRMINETEPIKKALAEHRPSEDEDIQPLIQIALYEGIKPRKGFDWVIERSGICSSITTLSSMDLSQSMDVRQYCVRRLVSALYRELFERLKADIAQRTGQEPTATTVRGLVAISGPITEEGYAHVDVSHLSSAVQMSTCLSCCEELELAREMCEYGQRLQLHLQYADNPPFEETYRAYGLYLAALAGDGVEDTLAYFRAQAEKADPETVGTYPAEVLVNLLLRLDRPKEALATARKHLAAVDNRRLSCPSISELCQQANDYQALADVARQQNDAVHFMAGLIEAGKKDER